jgi:muramoyltetrapeptide carboxypeptidase LdcA involved in peptidoglycan recycling
MKPEKLKPGNKILVIAPSYSLSIVSRSVRLIANDSLASLGLSVSYGENAEQSNEYKSSPVTTRISDIHRAFADKEIKGILTAIGGFNANQLLKHLDWSLLKNNPKIFCGYSDISVLLNAIYKKTGLITYLGPHYSTFGQLKELSYTLDYFKKCLFSDLSFPIIASQSWTDDEWWLNQEDRHPINNEGWLIVNRGQARGTAIGGNISSLLLIAGTDYMPDIRGSILFLEEEGIYNINEFDRELESFIQLPNFSGVRGLVIGRFQQKSSLTEKEIIALIKSKSELDKMPVVIQADFGHTNPMFTIPIGGLVELTANRTATLTIITH